MYEAILESFISIIIVMVYIAFWSICHKKHYFRKRERFLVLIGFSMICLSSILDITDAWGWRRNIYLIGNLDLTTVIEELVLFCGGFVCLAFGIGLWVHSLVGFEELEAIHNYTNDGIVVADAKTHKFLRVNDGICRITGYTRKELLNMRIEQIHASQDAQKFIELFNNVCDQPHTSLMVLENVPICTKQGLTVYCEISIGRLTINNKNYITSFMRDVTDRRHAFEIESRLASIVRSAENTILSVDTDLNVLTWNAAAAKLFGYEKEEILGKTAARLATPEQLDKLYELANSVLRGNSISLSKFQVVRKDGSTLFVSFTASPVIDVDGNIVGCSAVIRDITREVEAEAALEHERDTLKKLLEAYDRERKLISYEIHDGLAQYIGGATMQLQALMNLPDQELSAAKQILETCYSLMSRGLKETRGVINGLRPPVLDEFGIVAGIEHMACEEVESDGFHIEFEHHTSFERLQPLLENGIFRIVQEGISNARKHSQTKSVNVKLYQVDDQIFIEIKDRGVGFDPEVVTAQSFGIRGIKERVRLLGGQMEILSTKGNGTQLKVTLPLLEEETPSETEENPQRLSQEE